MQTGFENKLVEVINNHQKIGNSDIHGMIKVQNFASLIRRHVRAVQSPEKNTATAEIPVPLAQTIGTAIKNDNKQRKSLSESGYETATSIIRININSRSISAKMDAEQKAASSNDDNTIEEDIEEVISENESSDENRLITSPVEIQNESMSNRLFGGETSGNFTINDDALSGNRIARDLQSEKMEELNQAASKRRDETFSQNTENDASELEESSNLFVRSLDMKSSLLNVDPRDCLSLDSDVRIIQPRASNSDLNDSYERDHSLEEITEANHSIEVFLDGKELSSMDANINIDSKPQFSRILEETTNSLQSQEQSESSQGNLGSESDKTLTGKLSGNHTNRTEKYETDEDDLNDLKNKILSCPTNNASAKGSNAVLVRDISFEQSELQTVVVKRMERVESEYSKEALDDITEESEKVSLQHAVDNDNTSNDFDSIISLNMIQMLENKVKDLQEIVAGKDVCLASLNMQLDSAQKREIFAASTENRDSLRDLPPSGRESSSLATTSSTEYRTLFDDIGPKVFDFHGELYQRNQLIEKLTESLQQSIEVREQLQMESERLSGEVQNLRKQLAETIEQFKKPFWPRDQESSTTGQRLSEISIDLVSESDEDLERQFLTDNEEKMSISNRNSKERQLNEVTGCLPAFDNFDPDPFGVSKQIEQFQKYLNPDEMRIFFMVQKKYDDFLSQEIEKVKMKNDSEMKIIIEQLENEKSEKDVEINRLRHLLTSVKNGSSDLDQLRKELETVHSLEMGKLRTYFEKKCADLEKHYSEEVFSQKSQRLSGETSASDVSDQEMMHDENVPPAVPKPHIVKKRSLEELFASPLHRQLTPTTLDCLENESDATIEELKNFYKDKFRETSQKYEDNIKRLKDRLRRFEAKYADDEFMKKSPIEHGIGDRPNLNFLNDTGDATSSSYLIIDQDELGLNESQEIRQIAAEYERRLQEQVALAKMDIVHELENQIQALVSETTTDDNHWPPELILIREKFTAKSQLEIAQLQIKHEEEMSRLKIDFEKQLNRKNKRNSTFDLSRDLDQIVSERDNLRELSSTFLYLLQELAKFVSICEDDLNSTIVDELQKHGFLGKPGDHNVSDGGDNEQSSGVLNISNQSNQDLQDKLSKTLRYVPDVSGLLSLIEDPTLIDFIADSNREGEFKLKECVEKLRLEANALLVLSEKIHQNREKQDEQSSEKQDSCEEEDGLKAAPNRTGKLNRANSLGENVVRDESLPAQMQLLSLPADIGRVEICTAHQLGKEEIFESNLSSSEVNVTLNELQNRLVKSETERLKLGEELQIAIGRNKELGIELYALRDQLKRLDQSQGEDLSEGYGLSEIQSPPRLKRDRNASTSFSQLQDKARNLLGTPTKNMSDNTSVLLQLIEQFCREGDKVMESGKRDRDDLQAQIDAADKKLKDTRQFLDIQAADREAERDEFLKEIEKLKLQIREKDKERCLFEIASKEFEQMEQQIRDLTQQVSKYESQKDKLEIELKASIDKIFVLREIITNLETQVDTKSLNENCLNEKVKELEAFIASQARSNETLQHEVESLKTEISQSYQERITQLEEQLRNTRSNSEQNIAIEQLAEQLRDIETTLDQKTKTLESLHAACSNSLSDNYSEELSAQNLPKDNNLTPQASPINTPRHHSLPIDEIQRVFQKLSKHTRVEEAAIKKIKEQEMLVANIRTAYGELENDGKLLQEKMTEQVVRISSLQSKLDEQRRRAEELNRQGTSDFAARIHDLQTEVYNLKETLSARDKQIVNLKNHLEQSKKIIDRQEAELAVTIQGDSGSVERLEAILRAKVEEIQMLKDKMKKEMINKLALPDLMETMLADKNEEIDNLKEQVKKLQNELQGILNIDLGKNESSSKEKEKSNDQGDGSKGSGRTLSDIVSISEYDEPDVIRRAITNVDTQLELPQSSMPDKTMNSSKCAVANLTEKRSGDVTLFDVPGNAHPMRTFDQPNFFLNTATSSKIGNNTTPSLIPRQINFSEFADGTKIKESTPKIIEVTGQAGEEVENLRKRLKSSEDRAESLKMSLETIENEKDAEIRRLVEELDTKTQIYNDLLKEKQELERKVESTAELHETLKAKAAVQDDLHEKIKEKSSRISELELILEQKTKENTELQANLTRKSDITTDSSEKILELNHNIDMLSNQLKQKDDTISKLQQNVINLQQNEVLQSERLNRIGQDKMLMQTELDMAREQLSEQVLVYQKTLLDMESISAKYEALHSELDVKEQRLSEAQLHLENTDEIFDLRKKIEDLTERNRALETDLERLRSQSGDSKPYSLDEIAEKVEKELNYSAQLDTNILKAIESEDENNLDAHLKRAEANEVPNTYLLDELNALKAQIESERKNSAQLMHQLNDVRFQTQDIQQQDADIIEAMRIRLEEAIEKETELHKILDEEREKCERLSSQVSVLQRTEARKSSFLNKTPPDSPRKAAKAAEDAEAVERLKEDIKLANSQNERERERVKDLEKALEREKCRFEKELVDRIEYGDKLKREMDKLKHEKDSADEEVEHLQDRLTSATHEIECLETRIATLQEAETRRVYRRGKERAETTQQTIEMQDLRNKLVQVESERDHLNEVIKLLREDVDRGAQREAKLAGALANSGSDNSIPEQFMQKLKEMSCQLNENAKENRLMAEKLQYLTVNKNTVGGSIPSYAVAEMEERANHLFGKYLRVESHRKALAHQKRYLMLILHTYQENEAKALNLLTDAAPRRKKRRSFKCVALAVLAIERMKFIVRRWHTGRIVVSKSIFNMVTQRRGSSNALAAANGSVPLKSGKHVLTSLSPPCRDRPVNERTPGLINLPLRPPLQAPGLISECTDKLDRGTRWK